MTNKNNLPANDDAWQNYLLQGVSRTFALTIPLLPGGLRSVVGNAYLLCRVIDTIEDDPALPLDYKKQLAQEFVQVVNGTAPAAPYAARLYPLIQTAATAMEAELVEGLPRVIAITHGLHPIPRKALERCIRIMAEGMMDFQGINTSRGLPNLAMLNRYCYVVAGVVGEMLTELFCHYSQATAANYQGMMQLARSFGQGLQMTNILKDIWEDQTRSACWLPQDIFERYGFDLGNLRTLVNGGNFEQGLTDLIGIAHAHLQNAFRYTLMISNRDTGMRKFCLLALGMAILTLRKINENRQFTHASQVKISRQSVASVMTASRLFAANDRMLRKLFNRTSKGLPLAVLAHQ